MRALGVRFGAYHIYVPILLKPAPSTLLATLWALKNGGLDVAGLAELARLTASGRTSVPVDPAIPGELYRIVGYRLAGERAVRIDILERLADLIRPLIAWRPTPEAREPPDGAIDGFGFTVTVAMTSLLGCAGDDFASVLRSLGYRAERRPTPPAKPATAAPDAFPAAEVAAESSAATANTDAPAMESGDAPANETSEEPVTIEIWRPQRADRHRRRDGRPRRTERVAAAKPDSADSGAHADAERKPRPPRRRSGRKPGKPGRDGPSRPRPSAVAGDGAGRGREREPDPDSPFAALAALKAQLEAKERGG
jgi:ATP-dependent RNA helicase SUPV3L1/SUV3